MAVVRIMRYLGLWSPGEEPSIEYNQYPRRGVVGYQQGELQGHKEPGKGMLLTAIPKMRVERDPR